MLLLNETRKVFSFAFQAARGTPLAIESCALMTMDMVVHRRSRAEVMHILCLFQIALVLEQFEKFSFIAQVDHRLYAAS